MQQLYVFGAGMRARVALDLIAWEFTDGLEVAGYFDDALAPGDKGPGGHPLLGTVSEGAQRLVPGQDLAWLALGSYRSARGCELLLELRRRGVTLARLVSRRAQVSPSARIGDNALVLPGVYIGAEARIGDLFIAHAGVVVEHHAVVGSNVLLGPGTTLAGCVRVGSHCFVGAGCTIAPEVELGRGSLLGAGSLLIADLPAHQVAHGRPARAVRPTRDDDELPSRAEIEALAERGLS